jgi:GNAT superfamily N-acetyltransferase
MIRAQNYGAIGIHQVLVRNLGLPARAVGRSALFAATNETRTIGSIYVGEIADSPGQSLASFELTVEDGMRRCGWGTQLVQYAEAWARQFNFECMVISVRPENNPALALYDRLGYRLVWHERNRAIGPQYYPLHVLAKSLGASSSIRCMTSHLVDAA